MAKSHSCFPMTRSPDLPMARSGSSRSPDHQISNAHLINQERSSMSVTTIATTSLRTREMVAEGTMAFHFDRPAGFEFVPGQTMDITLNNPPETDAEGNVRTFSIASAPGDPGLMITTRLRDTAFKRVLQSIALPAEVKLDGPHGSFMLHKNTAKPAVFLAGGIGITPFFSIIQQAA